MARRPYSTAARLHKDSDQVVTLKWYPVAEPVQCLPFQSKVNSLDWSSHPWLASGVGEVWDEPRTYNGATALPYAVGMIPCEPAAVFREGEVLDPDRPDQVYNLDGFPACCLTVWTPEGGLVWDGSAQPAEPWNLADTCEAGGGGALVPGGLIFLEHPGGFASKWAAFAPQSFAFKFRLLSQSGGGAFFGVGGFFGLCSAPFDSWSLVNVGDESPTYDEWTPAVGHLSCISSGGPGQWVLAVIEV